jgi:hypothetical protein
MFYVIFNPFALYKFDKQGNPELSISFYRMLARPVCASIEEIFICTGVTSSNLENFSNYLYSFETNKEDLLVDYGKKSGDLDASIKDRFPRLTKICKLQTNFPTFITYYKKQYEEIDKSYFLADTSIKSIVYDMETYNTDTWYNGDKTLPSTYALDNDLKKRFSKIKEIYGKQDKAEKVKEATEAKYKKDMEGLDFAIERYTSLCSIPMLMRVIVQKGNSNGLISNLEYPATPYEKVVDYSQFPKGIKDVFIDKEAKLSTGEAIKRNKEVTDSANLHKLVTLTSTALIESLYKVYKESPITLAVIADKLDSIINNHLVNIIVPPSCRGMLDEMKPCLGSLNFDCDTKRVAQSIVNATWLFNICFIDNNSDTSKYNAPSTWNNMLAKARR